LIICQFDKKRFLFATQAQFSAKNFYGRTPDSLLYYFKCSSINISTADNKVTSLNIERHPRGTKQQFEIRLTKRKEMYNLTIPKLILSGINRWDFINLKNIIAN
jgi:hypothetical protein